LEAHGGACRGGTLEAWWRRFGGAVWRWERWFHGGFMGTRDFAAVQQCILHLDTLSFSLWMGWLRYFFESMVLQR